MSKENEPTNAFRIGYATYLQKVWRIEIATNIILNAT